MLFSLKWIKKAIFYFFAFEELNVTSYSLARNVTKLLFPKKSYSLSSCLCIMSGSTAAEPSNLGGSANNEFHEREREGI
jgi:hypothetical protein